MNDCSNEGNTIMPYKRFDELDPIKKQSIIDKSIEAFAENSFKAASLNGISREVGISAGALYYYFEDNWHFRLQNHHQQLYIQNLDRFDF